MSALNPRAVASQGVGFSPRVLAAQGLWPMPSGGRRFNSQRAPDRTKWKDDEEILLLFGELIASGVIQ
jgi:hypothetical protein